MGVASLVLGIISVIGGFIPACNLFFSVPALVGLILGIVDAVKKGKAGEPKGMSIAGIILNVIAFVVIIGMYVLVFAAGVAGSM
ncbi:MAG: hypothetical protein Q4D02_06505 [Clostridia bacterium]|nr:hypothetical protein [Clostridia bacterium]